MDNRASYSEAERKLFSLQTNKDTLKKWREERKNNQQFNIHEDMAPYLEALQVNLPAISSRAIHIAGTKGKGSTCAMVESVVRSQGYTTGLFTSPHLIHVRERIRINGKSISEEEFTKYFWLVWDSIESLPPTNFFKYLTLMTFKVFDDLKLDCPIFEVGIGGRTDATNVLTQPVVCGITSLGYDHMDVLGSTLHEIATEKAGIMKLGTPCVSVPQLPEAWSALQAVADKIPVTLVKTSPFQSYMDSFVSKEVKFGHSPYLMENASLAIALSDIWLFNHLKREPHPLKTNDTYPVYPLNNLVMDGLNMLNWPGRCQIQPIQSTRFEPVLPSGLKGNIYIDGAHTVESLSVCVEWFSQQVGESNQLAVIFNCNQPRDPAQLLAPIHAKLKGRLSHIVFCSSEIATNSSVLNYTYNHATDLTWQENMAAIWRNLDKDSPHPATVQVVPDVVEAYRAVIHKANPELPAHILISGSLYLVGAALDMLQVDTL